MNILSRIIRGALCVCCGAIVTTSASAFDQGALADGRRCAIGGVGQEDIALLEAQRASYSLRVVTAAKGSGAYLADVQVRISRDNGPVLFDQSLTGPWLLADLAPGKYLVEASYGGEVLTQATTIRAKGHQEIFFRFNLPKDDVQLQPQEKS